MMHRISLLFAVLPWLCACGEEEEEEEGNDANATMTASSGAGGMGAGGSGSTTTGSQDLCERGCEATLEADCENGPDDMEQCVTDCQNLEAGECSEEYAAFQACAEDEAISCQAGIPFVQACASEQTAFIACINQ